MGDWSKIRLTGTPEDGPNPLEAAWRDGDPISAEEARKRGAIRGVKGPPILVVPAAYPLVDDEGNVVGWRQDTGAYVASAAPPDPKDPKYECRCNQFVKDTMSWEARFGPRRSPEEVFAEDEPGTDATEDGGDNDVRPEYVLEEPPQASPERERRIHDQAKATEDYRK